MTLYDGNPIPCNVPRCTNPSIFTEHGMVGGHYWPMCVDHAHEWLAPHIARLARLSAARILHPRTGMPLLTGTKPTQRGARQAAHSHARQWTHRYGHLHTSR